MVCRRYVIEGLVQGVFFRATAQATAMQLGLTGWVRNARHGSVELVACGDATKLQELERWLSHGPCEARVDKVLATDVERQSFDGFQVIP